MDLFPLQMLQNDSDYKVTIAAVSPGSKLSTPTSANHDEVPVSTSSAHATNVGDVYRCTFPHCHKAFKELRLLKVATAGTARGASADAACGPWA